MSLGNLTLGCGAQVSQDVYVEHAAKRNKQKKTTNITQKYKTKAMNKRSVVQKTQLPAVSEANQTLT